MPELRYLTNPDISGLALDVEKCIGCRMCTEVCPHGVFTIENGKAQIVDRDACMECGACAGNCEVGAITVKSGVGCATAVIIAALRRTKAPCDGTDGSACFSSR